MDYSQNEQKIEDYSQELKTIRIAKYGNQSRSDRCPTLLLILLVFVLANVGLFAFLKPFDSSPNEDPAKWSKLEASTTEQTTTTDLKPLQPVIPDLKPEELKPFYIWLGDLPDRHKKILKQLKYQFRLIRNCDLLMAKMEGELLQKFDPWIYETVNLKSDVCRFVALYYYGGLYLDMDAQVDLECMGKYLKDKRIFFEATPRGTVDIFTIYSAKPYDPEILKALQSWTTFKSYLPYNTFLSTRIDKKAKTIATSGCVTHTQERSWKPLLAPGNQGK